MPAISNILNAVTALSKISKINGIRTKAGDLFDLNEANKIVNILSELDKQQQATALSSSVLSNEEKSNIASMLGLKTAEDGLTTSTTGLAGSFGGLAASLGTTVGGLATAIGIVAAIGIGIGTVVYKTNQANEELRKSAQKLGGAFNDSKKDISDYKAQIESLYETINSETASTNERREAREKLLSIQQEMLGKYGQEAESIDIITRAINGEIDALDKLTAKQWQKTKREFNQQNLKGFDGINRAVHGVDNNFDLMLKEMENRTVEIEFSAAYDKETIDMLQKLYGGEVGMVDDTTGFYILSGNLDEIQEKLLSIQDTVENFDLSATFTSRLSQTINENDKVLDAYSDIWESTIIQERIFNSEFEDNYMSFTDALHEYNKVALSEDEEAKEQALQNLRDQYDLLKEEVKEVYNLDIDEQKAAADSIMHFFEGLSPEITVRINKEKLKEDLDNVLKDGKTGEEVVNENIGKFSSKEELFDYGLREHDPDDPLLDAYNTIKLVADDAKMSVRELYEELDETGRLSNRLMSDNVKNNFGQYYHYTDKLSYDQFSNAYSGVSGKNQKMVESWIPSDWVVFHEQLTNLQKSGLDSEAAIRTAIINTNNLLSAQSEEVSGVAEEFSEIEKELENLGIDKSAFDQYVTTLMQMDEAFANDKEGAEQLALANMKASQGFEDLASNFDTYKEKITEGFDSGVKNTQEYSDAINGLAKDLTYITGSEFNVVDAEKFYQDAEAMRLLESALNGDNDALNRLRENAASGIYFDIRGELNLYDFDEQIQQLFVWLNSLDLSVGGEITLDDTPFLSTIAEVVAAGGEAAATLEEALNKVLGISVEVEYVTGDVPVLPGTPGADSNGRLNVVKSAKARKTGTGSSNTKSAGTKPTNGMPTTRAPRGTSTGGGGGGGGKSDAEKESDIMATLSGQLDEIQEKYKSLKEIMDDYNSTGKITVDQAQTILQSDFRYLALLGDETGALALNEQGFVDLAKAKLNEMQIQLARNALDTVNSINTEADAVKYLSNAYLDLGSSIGGAVGALQQAVAMKMAQGGAVAQAAQTIWQGYQNASAMLQHVDFSANGMGAGQDKSGNDTDTQPQGEEEEKYEEDFNWIERLLERLAKATEKWQKQANRFFTFWSKNWAVNKQIQATRTEADYQARAYKYYTKKASEVGLSTKYRKLVENGDILFETVTDKELGEKIKKYQEWYELAQKCKDSLEDLHDSELELIRSKLDNIVSYYETMERYYSSIAGKVDAQIKLKEARGERITMSDLLQQFGAQMGIYNNAREATESYRTGKESDISDHEQEKFNYTRSDFLNTDVYKNLIAQQDALQQKQAEYDETIGKIADLKKQIKETTDKQTKQSLKMQLQELQKTAKTQKLTSGEKKQLNSVNSNLDAITNFLTDFQNTYQQIIAKQTPLLEKQKKYSELIAKQVELEQQIAEARAKGDVQRVNDLQSQLKDVKKQAKKTKLTSSEESILKSLTQQKEAIEKIQDPNSDANKVSNDIASSAQYRGLLQKIDKLQDKQAKNGKLNKTDEKNLAMYLDEIAALNSGVLYDDLNSYISNYEQW